MSASREESAFCTADPSVVPLCGAGTAVGGQIRLGDCGEVELVRSVTPQRPAWLPAARCDKTPLSPSHYYWYLVLAGVHHHTCSPQPDCTNRTTPTQPPSQPSQPTSQPNTANGHPTVGRLLLSPACQHRTPVLADFLLLLHLSVPHPLFTDYVWYQIQKMTLQSAAGWVEWTGWMRGQRHNGRVARRATETFMWPWLSLRPAQSLVLSSGGRWLH